MGKRREASPEQYRRAEAEELYKTGARGGCSRRCGRGCSRRMEQRSSRGGEAEEKEEKEEEEQKDKIREPLTEVREKLIVMDLKYCLMSLKGFQ